MTTHCILNMDLSLPSEYLKPGPDSALLHMVPLTFQRHYVTQVHKFIMREETIIH